MAGKYRRVKNGEWLATIAHDEKFTDDGQAIWNDAKNAGVRKAHPNPNLLCRHQRLYIPEKKKKEEPKDVDALHKFIVKKPKVLLRLRILDAADKPIEGEAYKMAVGLEIFSGVTYAGPPSSTDTGEMTPGIIAHWIPIDETSGELDFPDLGIRFPFTIGELKEIEPKCTKNKKCSIRGSQERLNNLGFSSGPVDGDIGRKTRHATWLFQAYCDKHSGSLGFNSGPIDKIIGPITRGALKKFHKV